MRQTSKDVIADMVLAAIIIIPLLLAMVIY